MNPKQKIIVSQLQIAGCGMLVLVFGLFWNRTELMVLGACVAIYAVLRMRFLLHMAPDEMESPDQSLDQIIEEAKKNSPDEEDPDDEEEDHFIF